MYLNEALKYDVPARHEDRLTQVFAATFNNSRHFRRASLKFFGVPAANHCTCVTQAPTSDRKSRPDMIVLRDDKPYLVIESKLDARATLHQQAKHLGARAEYSILLTRDPIVGKNIHGRFTKRTWSDLVSAVLKASPAVRDPVEKFLINEFMLFAKECGLVMPDKILQSELDSAAKFFTEIRLRSSTQMSLGKHRPFESLVNISNFFERVLLKLREEPTLSKKVASFSRTGIIGSEFFYELRELASNQDKSARAEILRKTEVITIHKTIRLKRKSADAEAIFLQVSFRPYVGARSIDKLSDARVLATPVSRVTFMPFVCCGVVDKNGDIVSETELSQRQIGNFSIFYDSAVKYWRKVIR